MAAVTTATVEDDDIIQLVNDITSCYIDLHNVHIKPTWINLSVLLAYATKLRHSLTHQPTQLNSRAVGYKTDKKQKKPCSLPNDSDEDCLVLCGLKECRETSKLATISKTFAVVSNRMRTDPNKKTTPSSNSSEDVDSRDSEVMNITNKITQKGANGTMRPSRRDRTFSSPIKRSQSLNTHHRPRPSLHGNQVPEAIRPIRRSASQPAITDYTAKAMSDSYRLMTTTHSRLSSRDGSLTPPPVDELQARLKRYYQHQPVLGVRQRRLASRRRSVLGIEERKCLSVSHSRSHSDSLISQQHVSTQTEADIAAGQETVYSHHSEYYQAVENGKIYSANQLTRKIEILTNHNSLFDKVRLQGKARNVLETNVVLDSSVMLPDLYPERKEERVKHYRTLRSTSHSRLVNSNSPHVDHYSGYSHGKTIPSLGKSFERRGDKEPSINLDSPPPQAVVPTERYHQRTQSLNQMHDHSVQTSHARSQSWHSASQNHYHISKRLPVFAPVYFPSSDSVYKPGYITVSASGYGSTRSPIYAAVYAPLYDRIDDVIYATIDEIQPVDVQSGQERRLPIQFPQKGSNGIISAGNIWRNEQPIAYSHDNNPDDNNNVQSGNLAYRGDNFTADPTFKDLKTRISSYREPSHQTYHYNDDVKGRLRAGVTHNTTSSAVAPRHPVKRTASMPASMHPAKGPQRHQGSVRHSQDKYPLHTQSSRVLLRNETADGDSRRPGRGVFTSSGKRVHEGRRMSRDDQHRVKDFSSVEVPYNGTSHDLPPRLPARNSSSDRHQFRSPDRNYPKYVDKPFPRRGVSLDRSLTENMAASRAYSSKESHNSESNHKPIDHLRDRVRRQQEKEQQKLPYSHNNPGSTISPVSHPSRGITSGHLTSPEVHYSDSPSQELSPASVTYNGQYSHQYSHPHQQHSSYPQSAAGTVPFSSRTLSPQKYKAQKTPPTYSDYQTDRGPLRTTSHSQTLNQPLSKSKNKHDSYMRSTSASQHAKSASNKYKMLVCPDFFPVTKLHVMSKRKSRVDNFVEAESPLNSFKDSAADFGEGFYSRRSHNLKAAPPVIHFDDSFVENPQEQLLYPSTTPPTNFRQTPDSNPHYQLSDSTNQCIEVSPAAAANRLATGNPSVDEGMFTTYSRSPERAREGGSLFSVDVVQSVPQRLSSEYSTSARGANSMSDYSVPAELESNYEMLPHRIPSAAAVAQDKRHLRQTHTSPQKLSHHPRSKQSDVARESSHPQQSRTSPEASQDQPDRSQAKLQDKQDSLKTLHAVSALGESRVAYQQTGVSGQRGKTATVLAHIEPVDSEEGSPYSKVHIYNTSQVMSDASPAHPWEYQLKPAGAQHQNKIHHERTANISADSHFSESASSSNPSLPRHTHQVPSHSHVTPTHQVPFQSHVTPSHQVPSHSHVTPSHQVPSHSHVTPTHQVPSHSHMTPSHQVLSESHATHSYGNFVNLQSNTQNEDRLLERIKAQNDSMSNSSSVPDSNLQKQQHFYENIDAVNRNLPNSSKTSVSFNSISNPDYIYPPEVQQEVNTSYSNAPSSAYRRLAQTSDLRGSPDHIIPVRTSLIKYPTRPSLDKSEFHERFHRRSPNPAAALERSSERERHSSSSQPASENFCTDEQTFKFRKAVNFVEPVAKWIQSTEKLAESPPVEDFYQSSEFLHIPEAHSSGTQKDRADSSAGEAETSAEHEISKLVRQLESEKSLIGTNRGLGEDILSITKMWKNLPTKDSWDDKRQALLNDPIMNSISEKMEAILHSSSGEDKHTEHPKTLSIRNEPYSEFDVMHSHSSPKSPPDVTREPGEGSSDDLDDSIDLKFKRRRQHIQSQAANQKLHSVPTSNDLYRQQMAYNDASPSDQSNATNGTVSQSADSFKPDLYNQREHNSQFTGTVQAKHVTLMDSHNSQGFTGEKVPSPTLNELTKGPETSTQELSDSEESLGDEDEDINVFDTSSTLKPEESDESEDDLPTSSGVKYLSDYHKSKTKTVKKISFSNDATKSKSGDLISSSQSEALLSVNPFMTSSSLPLQKSSSSHLLSVNPFMVSEDKNTESGAEEGRDKPRQGILKRSEGGSGSQLSLGTCSEFGSHISLESGQSGISRAGSFPLLTMSDGSKKDFKITFNDSDTSDMSNLFKVNRKARSEGAASEPESTDSESDDDAMPVVCKNCLSKQPLFKARLVYKMCHGCYTYYCSSQCRRQDWAAHKPLCIVSRLGSLAKKIFKCVMTDEELLHHCSRFARTGYLCEGRGAVVLSFASPRKAQLFLSNAKQAKESALYLCVKDLQKFTFDDKRDKDQLLANCKHYNPDEKFVLHLAIKMSRGISPQTVEPRIRGREFHKWARIRLSDRHNLPKGERYHEEDTLILTAISSNPDQSTPEMSDHKSREVFFATVLTKLRKRGISLRHQYPDVYNALCQYVTSGKPFAPVSLFAFNLHTQKRFMCCIMPYSDPDVTWGNNPHLLEDLDLAVTF